MNKYYIGYPLPEHVRETIRQLFMHVMGNAAFVDVKQLHITALHLGARPRDEAERVFNSLPRRNLPVMVEFDTYDRFGDHLVIKLVSNSELTEINRVLANACEARGKQYDYNPHITIAHGKKAFIRIACPEEKFTLGSICLFEKPEGGEYDVHRTTVFR